MDGIRVVYGVLLRRRAGDMWLSKAIALNCRLADYCKAFVDNWGRFFGKDHLYIPEGRGPPFTGGGSDYV